MELLINGIRWYVVFVPPKSKYLQREDGTYTLGMTDGVAECIYISNELNKIMLEKVLTHELSHATSFSYGCVLNENIEEIVADFMANYGKEIIYNADKLIKNGLHNLYRIV